MIEHWTPEHQTTGANQPELRSHWAIPVLPSRRSSTRMAQHLRKLDKFQIIRGPMILGAVRQQDDPLGLERFHRTGIVRDEHDRASQAAQRAEDLRAAGPGEGGCRVLCATE